MNVSPKAFLIRWAVTSVGVLVATQIVPGIECRSWSGLFVAALVLGLLNAFVRPLLLLLSLPLVIVTLGLFLWIINATLLYCVGWLVKPFQVAGFGSALLGAAVISIVSALVGGFVGAKVEVKAGTNPRRRDAGPGGPVIDV